MLCLGCHLAPGGDSTPPPWQPFDRRAMCELLRGPAVDTREVLFVGDSGSETMARWVGPA